MGCASSTEIMTDPYTGQQKKKKKLGGAYPGQRRPQHTPYVPPASDFGKDGTATAHFIAHGGGNALTLVQQDGSYQPQSGQAQPDYVQVTLPDGVTAGQTIHVQAPDGRLNAIVVPPGFGPGSTFTVEFAPEALAQVEAPMADAYTPPPPTVPHANKPYAIPEAPPAADDGFASGFNNPNYMPSSTATPVYSSPYSNGKY